MTVALHDEVVTAAPARKLRVVRDADTTQAAVAAPAPKKAARKVQKQPVLAGDPLVEGATRLLSVPLRHVYAALWRVGVLEVQA
ncbi:Rv1535 family protein [Mycobacterium europaeum]|uniref:Rv1535 family protein n=1 Tax=Mycobacterium europaeum TaxID=761804 RepID=UPI002ADF3A6E|nr:Rv1535 family protein [Mycobacterium europaeum]MEA1162038.1 Rv1535 family protein [Mycobacterium europaeum]